MDWLVLGDLLLLLGLTLRLTRLIVADDFPGTWLIREPAARWAAANDWRYVVKDTQMTEDEHGLAFTGQIDQEPDPGWRTKAVEGLSCPFCIGFWIAAAMMLILAAVGGPGHAPDWWRIIAGIFALNWVAAHLGARAGDAADE